MTERPTGLTVRMYQVGFGDCFLLTFHYPKGDRHVLIDFGSTKMPAKAAPKEGLLSIAKAIKEVCKSEAYPNGKLTAVVATHRHADHISGFATKARGKGSGDLIAAMRPELVVQPWTEDPEAETDAEEATRASTRGLSKRAFVRSLRGMNQFAEAAVKEVARRTVGLNGKKPRSNSMLANLAFIGETNIANPSAVKNLMDMGKRSAAEYLAYGAKTRLARLLPGVKVHVLGPPNLKQTKAILKEKARDPGEFWHLLASSAIPAAKASSGATKAIFPRRVVPKDERPPYTRWLIPQLDKLPAEQMLELVRILDKAMNNTSVILLFEIGDRAFLFPGDAQVENWLYALKHAKDREQKLAILRRVELYKVGHHGSLNATPKSLWALFFEDKPRSSSGKERLKTLVSTLAGKHGQKDRGTEVPREKLIEELKKKSEFFSTDSEPMAAIIKEKDSPLCVERLFTF
jgi:Metallo-beta-lactamase superfamily